jgi:PAS domain S-box-containing protein
MVTKSVKKLQLQLNQVTAAMPDLKDNEHWPKVQTGLKHLSQRIAIQESLLALATAISNTMSSIEHVDQLLPNFVQLIEKKFDFAYVGLFLVDETNQWIKLKAETTNAGISEIRNDKIEDASTIGQAIRQQSPCLVKTTDQISELVVPLNNRGQTIGALKIQSRTRGIFSKRNMRLFMFLADQLASAIQNARLLAGTDQQLEQLVTLYNINMRIGSHLDVNVLLNEIAQVSVKLVNADMAIIRLLEPTNKQFRIKAAYNLPKKIKLDQAEKLGTGVNAVVLQTQQPVVANNWPDHPFALEHGGTVNQYGNVLALLNVPMALQHEVIGTIEVYSFSKLQAFGENDLYVLSLLASQTAIAVENAKLLTHAENNRRFLKTIIDHIPDPIFIKDKNHIWIEMNEANADVIGKPAQEIIGQTDRDHFSPEWTQEFYRRDNEVIATNRIYEYEDRTVWADGKEHIAYTRLIPLPDASGQPSYVLGISHDITDQLAKATENTRLVEKVQQELVERERAEQASRANEKKYRELVENANSIIFRMDTQGRVTFFNKFAQEFFGYSEEEILGHPIFKTIVPEVDTSGQALKEMVEGILQRPEQYASNENENVRRNGERVWVSWANKAIVDDSGQIVEILCIGNDITERRKALADRELAQRALATRERYLATQLNIQNYLLAYRGDSSPYDKILKLLGRVSGAGRVRVFENHFNGQEKVGLSQRAEWCAKGVRSQINNPVFQNINYEKFLPRWLNILGQGGIISGTAASLPEAEQAILEPQEILAILILPLMVSGEFFGFISFENCRETRAWDASEINLLRAAASSISLWQERRQAEESLLKALKRTESLYRIGNTIATGTEASATFETVLGEYLRLVNLKWGAISLVNKASVQKIQTLYLDGQPTQTDMVIPVEAPIFQHLLKNPTPLIIGDTYLHPLTKDTLHVRSQFPARSLLYIPISLRGQVIGVLAVGSAKKDYNFSQSDVEIGQVVTDQLAIWLENRQLLAEAQYRSDRLQTAAEVSRAASSILDVDELINTSVNLIQDQFGFYYVGLFLVDEAGAWAVLRAGTGEAGKRQLAQGHKLRVGGESMIGWSVQNRVARIALDVGQDAVRFKNPALPDTHSEMALPLISGKEVLGALTIQSTERGAFSDEDITLLQTMADQLAIAIKNARLFENVIQTQAKAETRLQETLALQQLSAALASTLQKSEILQVFFDACIKEIDFEYVQFCLVDKSKNCIRAIAGVGVSESNIKRANRPLDSNDILADIVRTGKTEIISGWDDRFHKETFEAEGHANWVRVFMPIILRQENIGVVEAGFNKNTNKRFENTQLRLLKAFINQTALALDNAERYEASLKQAKREALIKEITTKVRASTDLDAILQTTVKEIGDAIGSRRTSIQLNSSSRDSGHN